MQSDFEWIHGSSLAKKFIEPELIRSVINNIEESNYKIKCLSPFWLGESLMHPRAKEIIHFIFEENKKKDIFDDFIINTNGVLFDAELTKEFLQYAKFISEHQPHKNIFVTFSIDFVNPKVFKKVKGGNQAQARKVLSNIEYLIKARAELGLVKPNIVYKLVVQNANQHEVMDFLNLWSKKLDRYGAKYELIDSAGFFNDRDSICINKLYGAWDPRSEKEAGLHEKVLTRIGFHASDYTGKIRGEAAKFSNFRRPCFQLWNELLITSQGMVTPCCRDTRLKLSIGNIHNGQLLDMWQGEELSQLRLRQIKGEWNMIPLCLKCADPAGGSVSDAEVIKYLTATGRQEELNFYLSRIKEEIEAQKKQDRLTHEVKKLFSFTPYFQLKVYDYYIHRDGPSSFIQANKIGGLEFETDNSASLEIKYRFGGSGRWIVLDYAPKCKDWSPYNFVHIRLKGDGKGGTISFVVTGKDGDEWAYSIKDAFKAKEWREFILPFENFTQPEGAIKGDVGRVFDNIAKYRILLCHHESAVGQDKTIWLGNIWLSTDDSVPLKGNGLGISAKKKSDNLCVCLISREYPPETSWGGIGTYTHRLARGLTAAGVTVHVVCQGLVADRDYEDEGVYVHRVSHKSFFLLKGKLREFGLRWEYSQSVYEKVRELIKKYHIDLVEAPNLSGEGFIYSFHKKTPLVTRLHTHFSEVAHFLDWEMTMDRRLSCWFEDAAILRSDIITCSTQAHARLVASEIKINPSKIKIVPLGVEIPELSCEKREGEPTTVLFVGRLEKRKGIHILMQAIPAVLSKIPQVRFLIAGRDTYITDQEVNFNGPQHLSYKDSLIKTLPEEYRNRVEFLGHVSDEELKQLYRACDIFVAPSLYESFGQIYVEAMSYGKPVIGCSAGGVPEVVNNGKTGILVPPGDADRLSGAMIALLQDAPMARELGLNARAAVLKYFSIASMVRHTLNVYQGLVV
jgi:hypothetical protein